MLRPAPMEFTDVPDVHMDHFSIDFYPEWTKLS